MFKIFIVICVFLALPTSESFSQKLGIRQEKKVISLDLRDRPLKLVVEEIYKQTGCKIVFDEKWNDLPLSGQYTGITLEEFFWKALRKYNVSFSYDDKSNAANLSFFGDKNSRRIANDTLASRDAANGEVNKEIKVMREEQRQSILAYFNDPESIDPVSGMKLVEIKEMRSAQRAEQELWQNNPESIDSVSGMRLVDIKEMRSAQRAEQELWQNNPESIDPVSGMRLVDIKEMRSAQREDR